jgi:hypothetical protein
MMHLAFPLFAGLTMKRSAMNPKFSFPSAVTSALTFALIFACLTLASPARAELCSNAVDMDAATRGAMERAALTYFDDIAHGNSAALQQNSISAVASNFSGVQSLVSQAAPIFSGAQANIRATYLLDAGGTTTLDRAEFLCGIWGTPQFVSFVIPNLPPGKYGLVIEDVKTTKDPYYLSFVLQQETPGAAWKLAGLPPPKPAQINGKDAPWYLVKAREFKSKGEVHNAWFYYQKARDLVTPVSFINTTPLVKLDKEAQASMPADLPINGPVDLAAAGGKSYKLTQVFPVQADNGEDLVVKYSLPDISDTAKTFADNMAVIKAVVTKYPEYRETFTGVVARAVDPNGKDYGTLLAMKDIK